MSVIGVVGNVNKLRIFYRKNMLNYDTPIFVKKNMYIEIFILKVKTWNDSPKRTFVEMEEASDVRLQFWNERADLINDGHKY